MGKSKSRGGFLRKRKYTEADGELRTILKKRKTIEGIKTKNFSMRAQQPPRSSMQKKKKIQVWQNANLFLSRFRSRERQLKTMWRARRANTTAAQTVDDVPPSCGLVVRNSEESVPSSIKAELEKLRLGRTNSAVFMRIDAPTLTRLKVLDPYLAVAYPSPAEVSSILAERGYCAIKNGSAPISDNVHVENVLGKLGILCVADVSHHLSSVGDHFDEVASFVVPIRLEQPKEEDKTQGNRQAKAMDKVRVDKTLVEHVVATMNSQASAPKKRKRSQPKVIAGHVRPLADAVLSR